jgi:hypothetical protein
MNVAAKHQSKMHSAPPVHHADMHSSAEADMSESSMPIKSRIEGELADMPGQKSASLSTADYGVGKHEAYDSQLAQPAYSGHGKVRVGTTSAL